MELQLTHRDATRLFPALIDQELAEVEQVRLREHLDGCDACRQGWERYSRAVGKVRSLERERAPAALATVIARRVRRRRTFAGRGLALAHANYRVPFEVIIPILLGVLVAALLLLAAP